MAASETVAAGRRDPWPSAQPSWRDPPWLLAGRVVTAWFLVPWALVEASMSPDLRPARAEEVRIRLRFYELGFRAPAGEGQALAPAEGRFRETAIGFPARSGTVEGESSLFMWTDSDTYLTWAREAFGWPLVRGHIDLHGTIWSASDLAGATGGARVDEPWGSAAIEDARVEDRLGAGSPAGCWLTPRRVLRRAGLDGETRELLVVRPRVRSAGARYAASGRVVFAFRAPHPLAALEAADAELELVDGFELVVGEDVDVL